MNKEMYALEIAVTQSIFESVKSTVETDGVVTLPLLRVKRQIDALMANRDARKPPKLSELRDFFTKTPVEFSAYGTAYVAVILDTESVKISNGRVKQLERSKGKIIYKRNSRVIESRRPKKQWRTNENATTLALEMLPVTIMTRARWETRIPEAEKAPTLDEKGNRYSGKAICKKKRIGTDDRTGHRQYSPYWLPLAKNIDVLATIPKNNIFSIGFGLDKQTPLRVASYPLLGFELLRSRPQSTMEWYVATQFSFVGGLTQNQSYATERTMYGYLAAFVSAFYPDVANRISLLRSQPLTPAQLRFIGEILVPILSKKKQFRDFANARNGNESLAYMAAHTLYMRDPLPIEPSLYINPPDEFNRPIVVVGGDGERIMTDARACISEALNGSSNSILYTTVGRSPPYFNRENEPVVGGQLSIGFLETCSPEIYRDYAFLLVAIAKELGDNDIQYSDVSAVSSRRTNFLSKESVAVALYYLNELSMQAI